MKNKSPLIIGGMVLSVALLGAIYMFLDSDENKMKNAVKDILNDPDSVKFGTFVVSDFLGEACVGWNAKNKFGGYGGWKVSMLAKSGSDWVITKAKATREDCEDMLSKEEFQMMTEQLKQFVQ